MNIVLETASTRSKQVHKFRCVGTAAVLDLDLKLLENERQDLRQIPLELDVHYVGDRLHEID